MKILHVNSSYPYGGAARAAYRIHKGLLRSGIDSRFLAQEVTSRDESIIGPQGVLARNIARIRPRAEQYALQYLGGGAKDYFSPAWFTFSNIRQTVVRQRPDIVHLHWVCGGSLNPQDLVRFDRPIIWTLHDMWPFTGGCHYAGNCVRYRAQCGQCPQLNRSGPQDVSSELYKRKQMAWQSLDISVAAPSRWIETSAKQSSLFQGKRIEMIPTGVELERFTPGEKQALRQDLGLPVTKKLILFGAVNATGDRRKGFDLLQLAIRKLGKVARDRVELVVFGSNLPNDPPDFGFPIHYLGRINDDRRLATVYSAADVMLVPSREDNLPNTAVESIACGTPVVAFNVGGMSDIVDHLKNGYLATPFETDSLARGIEWVLDDETRYPEIAVEARKKAVHSFDIAATAIRYRELYESLL